MQTQEPQFQELQDNQRESQQDHESAIIKPANIGMSDTFWELLLVLGLLGFGVYQTGRVGFIGTSILDLLLILGVTALWIYAIKRLKVQENLTGNIRKLTYLYCGTFLVLGIASCIDPFGESAFPGIFYLLFFVVGFVFHIVLLKTYSGKMRRYSISWIIFAVLSLLGSLLLYNEPVEPDIAWASETELTDFHVRTLEEISNTANTFDWAEVTQSITLFAQVVVYWFFVSALNEGAIENPEKSTKRKILAAVIGVVSAVLMQVVKSL